MDDPNPNPKQPERRDTLPPPVADAAPEDGGAREIAHTLVTIVCEFPPPTHSEQCDRITAAISRERAATKVAHDGLVAAADELSKARAALAASEGFARFWEREANAWAADRDRLAAEVERLRGALQQISQGEVRGSWLRRMCEEALAPPATPKDTPVASPGDETCGPCGGTGRYTRPSPSTSFGPAVTCGYCNGTGKRPAKETP